MIWLFLRVAIMARTFVSESIMAYLHKANGHLKLYFMAVQGAYDRYQSIQLLFSVFSTCLSLAKMY